MEQSFPWERSEENGQGPHFLFLWDGCRHGTGGHKGDLIHHGENSLELSASVSGHHVIKRFLTKVIWGKETWGGPFKRHLSRLNKVHGASSRFILWLIYFCATLHYFSHESHEVWFIFLHYKHHYLFKEEPVEIVTRHICWSTIMVPYFHFLLFNNATSQHFTGEYCTCCPSTFCLADVVTSYSEGQD